jgi:hypothetical protein
MQLIRSEAIDAASECWSDLEGRFPEAGLVAGERPRSGRSAAICARITAASWSAEVMRVTRSASGKVWLKCTAMCCRTNVRYIAADELFLLDETEP